MAFREKDRILYLERRTEYYKAYRETEYYKAEYYKAEYYKVYREAERILKGI